MLLVASSMSHWDLTSLLLKYLDPHLGFVLVEFLEKETTLYVKEDVLRAKLGLVAKTKTSDWIIALHNELKSSEEEIVAVNEQKTEFMNERKKIEEEADRLLTLISTKEIMTELKKENLFSMGHLKAKYNITDDDLEALYKFATFQYEVGAYGDAAEFLFQYRLLCTNEDKKYVALWGLLAAEIMIQSDVKLALADLYTLRDALEQKTFASSSHQLQHRAWLLHWSLFLFFEDQSNVSNLLEFFFHEKYLNTIQTHCPHLLRYLVAASLYSHFTAGTSLSKVVSLLRQEVNSFRDPLTEFLSYLLIEFDFNTAFQKIGDIAILGETDFFLTVVSDLVKSARFLYFETHLKVHRSVDLNSMSVLLNVNPAELQTWAVSIATLMRAEYTLEAGILFIFTVQPTIGNLVEEKLRTVANSTINIESMLQKHLIGQD